AVETLSGHTGGVTGLALSRDGRTLYSASLDGRIIVWDLGGAHRLGRPFTIGPTDVAPAPCQYCIQTVPFSYALSSDGTQLAVGHLDGSITVVDARTLKAGPSSRPLGDEPIGGLAYAPHGGPLVVTGTDGSLALVDPRTGVVVQRRRDLTGGPA